MIDNLTYPVVIGRDFLMHYGSIIDMQVRSLVSSVNPPITLNSSYCSDGGTDSTDESVTVHAYNTYILPPYSESVIPVYPKKPLAIGSTGLIEPSSKLAERYNTCDASQLVSFSEDHTFPFRVLNRTNKPVTIYRCSTMGTYTPSALSMSVIATAEEPPPPTTSANPIQTVPPDLSNTDLTDTQ